MNEIITVAEAANNLELWTRVLKGEIRVEYPEAYIVTGVEQRGASHLYDVTLDSGYLCLKGKEQLIIVDPFATERHYLIESARVRSMSFMADQILIRIEPNEALNALIDTDTRVRISVWIDGWPDSEAT